MSNGLSTTTERPGRVLDLGCADGRKLHKLHSLGQVTVGLELDGVLVSKARAGFPTALLIRGDGVDLPVRDRSFSRIELLEVLEHVTDPRALVAECNRVLQPSGELRLSVPTWYTEAIYARLHPRYLSNAGHVGRFNRREIVALLSDTGFRNISIRPIHLEPAIAWFIHSMLRTDATVTGDVRSRGYIDRLVGLAVRNAERLKPTRFLAGAVRMRIGKSYEVRAYRADTPLAGLTGS